MSSDELWSELYQQTIHNKQDREDWENVLKEVDQVLAEARRIINFRIYYNRWLKNTRVGQAVKNQLFADQKGRCFKCSGELRIPAEEGQLVDHSEIHHLAPLAVLQKYFEANPDVELSRLQAFVISARYLRLVHPICNKQLGEQVGNLPELKFLIDFLQETK